MQFVEGVMIFEFGYMLVSAKLFKTGCDRPARTVSPNTIIPVIERLKSQLFCEVKANSKSNTQKLLPSTCRTITYQSIITFMRSQTLA